MKRVILTVPQGLTFDMLNQEQQYAINLVFGRYVNPMPGSISHAGKQLVDALTKDNFDPTTMADYGIDWTILCIAQWDGEADEVTIIQPLAVNEYRNYMPANTVTECHRWSGWPDGGFTEAFSEGFTQ